MGLKKDADQKTIKSAYYKLAKQYHPDVNPNNGEKFKEVSAAYDTLGDAAKKKEYDNIIKYGSPSSNTAGYG